MGENGLGWILSIVSFVLTVSPEFYFYQIFSVGIFITVLMPEVVNKSRKPSSAGL